LRAQPLVRRAANLRRRVGRAGLYLDAEVDEQPRGTRPCKSGAKACGIVVELSDAVPAVRIVNVYRSERADRELPVGARFFDFVGGAVHGRRGARRLVQAEAEADAARRLRDVVRELHHHRGLAHEGEHEDDAHAQQRRRRLREAAAHC